VWLSPHFNSYGRLAIWQVLRYEPDQPVGYRVSICFAHGHRVVEMHGHVDNRHRRGFRQGAGTSDDLRALALLKASGRVAGRRVLMEFGYLGSDSTLASEDADIRLVPWFEGADGSSTQGLPHLLNTVDLFAFLRLPSHINVRATPAARSPFLGQRAVWRVRC
jgi:hypothetical protein